VSTGLHRCPTRHRGTPPATEDARHSRRRSNSREALRVHSDSRLTAQCTRNSGAGQRRSEHAERRVEYLRDVIAGPCTPKSLLGRRESGGQADLCTRRAALIMGRSGQAGIPSAPAEFDRGFSTRNARAKRSAAPRPGRGACKLGHSACRHGNQRPEDVQAPCRHSYVLLF